MDSTDNSIGIVTTPLGKILILGLILSIQLTLAVTEVVLPASSYTSKVYSPLVVNVCVVIFCPLLTKISSSLYTVAVTSLFVSVFISYQMLGDISLSIFVIGIIKIT